MMERRIFYWTGGAILAAAAALASVGISALRPSSYISNAQLYFSTWFAAMTVLAVWRLVRERPDSPFGAVRRHWLETDWPRLRMGLPLVICAILFMPSFSAVKSAIPLLNDYSWDSTFIAWDRAIHGTDPWKLLQPVLGYPIITSALSFAYHLWIVLIYVMNLYFALLVKDRVLTGRFFVSFLLLWSIGGMAMAVLFASVGPCFAWPILGNETFVDQMAYLKAADKQFPVLVLDVQQLLLFWNFSGEHGLGRGITAMPSMHVGLAFLFFLAMRHQGRIAAWGFGAFFVVIALASVHLGYHYAVDGYASMALASLIWWASKYLVGYPQAAEEQGGTWRWLPQRLRPGRGAAAA